MKSFLNGVKESLKRKPFFEYFLSEASLHTAGFIMYFETFNLTSQLPGVTHQEKFADSTLQVWAITGTSTNVRLAP